MLIGGVVGYKVQDELEVALVGLVQQGVQILKGPEERMHIGVIGNVIAKIRHRRWIDGRDPNRVDAERLQIRQAPRNPLQVADALTADADKSLAFVAELRSLKAGADNKELRMTLGVS